MANIQKAPPSTPAILMYCIIGITAVTAAVFFTLYYGNFFKNPIFLWVGIVSFTIMYHLWMRIIMGNVSKLFKVSYKSPWFKEKGFEKPLYKLLRVKKWKGKALTYNPELYDVKTCSLEDIANTTAKSELDHLINIGISLSTVAFGFIWGELWIFAVTAFFAALFDSHFIVIQRYNRPRLIRLIKREKGKSGR